MCLHLFVLFIVTQNKNRSIFDFVFNLRLIEMVKIFNISYLCKTLQNIEINDFKEINTSNISLCFLL